MDLENQVIEVQRGDKWILVNMEDLKPGENFRVKPLRKKMKYNAYLHSDKSSNGGKADEFGLRENEKFMDKFAYSLYEVELNMEVDTETGESWILGIKGIALEQPVKA